MKDNNKFKVLIIILAILFFPITLLVLCFKGSGSNKQTKQKDNDEMTMDEIIDIEELFED